MHYAAHLQNLTPGHQKWYYLAVRFNVEKEWVVTAAWGKIGYSIASANQKHQSTKEDGSKFSNAQEAVDFLLGVIEKRLKHGYFIVYSTAQLLGILMSKLETADNPYQGVVTDWMVMYKRGHNAVVYHAPQWFKDVVTVKVPVKVKSAAPKLDDEEDEKPARNKKSPTTIEMDFTPLNAKGHRKIDKLMKAVVAKTGDEEEGEEDDEPVEKVKGKCNACEGSGKVNRGTGDRKCSLCNGTGSTEIPMMKKLPRKHAEVATKQKEKGDAKRVGSIRGLFKV